MTPIDRQRRIAPNLILRAQVLGAIRAFFQRQGFMEVDTPLRVPLPIPEAAIEPEPAGGWVLLPSPEICMKPLLAAGFERIYQICHCFRKGERGRRHLPESTLLEWYAVDWRYTDLMNQCEALIRRLARIRPGGKRFLVYQGHTVALKNPWPRLTVADAFDRFGSMPMAKALACDRFDEIMGLEIEPQLGFDRPTFLLDYPIERASLAKPHPDRPGVAERFELYIAGVELCNGFTELTDPSEQRRRFKRELKERRAADLTVHALPEPFLDALKAMPAAAGNALGVDRLVMLLADAHAIDEVVAFTPEDW
jgi:lysyl-tRNA synthetase class 2